MNGQEEIFRNLVLQPEPWTAAQIALNILAAFLLGLFITWVYRSTQRTLTTSFTFMNTLVMLSLLMTLVMMVIGSNIARAFGLAGAMSIIRFRTVVKDTRDTAYVFYSLGVGMASGTGNLKIAALGTLLVGLCIGILHWTRHGAVARDEYMLSFLMLPTDSEAERTVYLPLFESYFHRHELLSVKSTRMGEALRLTFHVVMQDPSRTDILVSELSALEGVHRVALNCGDEAEN
jgi:uncharacterized membrane protein YhiD involved in acid resistance